MSAAAQAIFLSYASQDAEAARKICDALRGAGVEVWFDQSELRGGDAWDQKIRRQIKECALFVPIISANTQARREGYFRREWNLAAARTLDMARGKPFLLPVVIDEIRDAEADVPEEFTAVQWTRLADAAMWPAFASRLKELLLESAPSAPVVQRVQRPGSTSHGQSPTRWRWLLAALLVLFGGGTGVMLVRQWRHEAEFRRLHEVLLPEIDRQIAKQDIVGAYGLAVQAEIVAPNDAGLERRWPKVAARSAIESTPPGADVYVKPFQRPQEEWRYLGKTPLAAVRLPNVYTRWRVEKPGCAPLETLSFVTAERKFALSPAAAVPAEMVRVAGATTGTNSTGLVTVRLPEFLMDRFEVTNRQFKEFVDGDGYARSEHWQQPFVREGRTLAREDAMKLFRDATGQPGPAGWRDGTFPEGAAELPVTGVSWFEAAAYAAWAGKRLPSIFHWRAAAISADEESIVPLSNFSGKGLARGGVHQGVSAFGVYDLAGNAKEWCANAANGETRYILGGAWREPEYMFVQADAMSPLDRSEFNGFRCIRLVGDAPLPAVVDQAREPQVRQYENEQPVGDEVFAAFRSLYSYDKGPLEARIENIDDADSRWRREKISYRAAYGDERVSALLFLPKSSAPPYQTIVYFPGAGSISSTSSETNLRDLNAVGVLVASGRALIYPIYKGTYERRSPGLNPAAGLGGVGSAAYRDWLIMLAKDLGRTIDYLETRPDLDAAKLAYAGMSWGGALGAILPALEKRVKASVLIIGGFYAHRGLPESEQINFAPRNTTPTLMLGGRYDFRFPLETSQRPMFQWLGAPPEHKRHVLFDTGHALKPEQIASAAYAWLDQHLGLVK